MRFFNLMAVFLVRPAGRTDELGWLLENEVKNGHDREKESGEELVVSES
jgi:hypothetical protein